MSFLHPTLLWFLLAPALLLVRLLWPRAAAARTKAHPKIPRAVLRRGELALRHPTGPARPIAACAALAFLVLALARPQGGLIDEPVITESRDVVVAVDVSRSMLAEDVSPSRLERARLLIRALADELRGERLGLLPFAGTAFLQSPLSADYEIFNTFLDELGPDLIPAGGSDFAAVLAAAAEAFGPVDPAAADAPPPADRFLIILSDGEAETDAWRASAQTLAEQGVRVLALGLGTAEGTMIPDGSGGLVKDARGAVVLSRLDASTLREVARLTDGAYRDASTWVDLPALLRETVARGRASRVTADYSPRRDELFGWFLAPALALLALAFWREFPATPRQPGPRPPRLAPPPLPTRYASALALFLALAATLPGEEEAAPPPDPLVELVGRLATASEVGAADYAALATLSAERGESARAAGDAEFPRGALEDGLAATVAGRAADPRAADWTGLARRLEALLAPPPPPPESQSGDSDSKPPESGEQSEGESSDSNESSDTSDQSQQSQQSGAPENSDASPSSESDPADDKPDNGEGSQGEGAPPEATPPFASNQAFGDLTDSEPETDAATPNDAQADAPPPPTQRAGGVSASGQEGSTETNGNPALTLPRQRLERVRSSDAPARLYQLMQDAEAPPDADRKSPGSPTRDW